MPADHAYSEFQPDPSPRATRDPDACTVSVSSHGRGSVVHVSGDLDLAARELVYRACLSAGRGAVEVDLGRVSFMDCAGYGGLVAAGVDLRASGGSLVVRPRSGQPAYLFDALVRIETAAISAVLAVPDVMPR